MPDDLRSLATAHRVLAGVSLLAVLLIVLGSVASLIEIINAPPGALRWSAAAVLVLVGLCWLITVLRSRPPEHTTVLGYLSSAMLFAGAALAGWNAAAAAPAAQPPATRPPLHATRRRPPRNHAAHRPPRAARPPPRRATKPPAARRAAPHGNRARLPAALHP